MDNDHVGRCVLLTTHVKDPWAVGNQRRRRPVSKLPCKSNTCEFSSAIGMDYRHRARTFWLDRGQLRCCCPPHFKKRPEFPPPGINKELNLSNVNCTCKPFPYPPRPTRRRQHSTYNHFMRPAVPATVARWTIAERVPALKYHSLAADAKRSLKSPTTVVSCPIRARRLDWM